MKLICTAGLCALLSTMGAAAQDNSEETNFVDLSTQEMAVGDNDDSDSHVLSNPWWRNLDIYGFGAAGYYDTGREGTRANGSFEIKEVSAFLEADVWEGSMFFLELQINRLGKDDQLFVRTGEVYLQFRDLAVTETTSIGLKIGRFDIPFGEEYLWQDAIDNPLITNSAPYVYGWDEGVLVYGEAYNWSWIAAITDGTDTRSADDNSDKAFNLKLSRAIGTVGNLSFSAMRHGDVAKSAVEFGGSHFEPVGSSHFSSQGVSPSTQVGADLLQVDISFDYRMGKKYSGSIAAFVGAATQSDSSAAFDRDIRWFSIEPTLNIGGHRYIIARYSEIGTYDSNDGYHFDGKTFAGGNSAFGYDTKRFRRLSLGFGWTPNERILAKLEIGKDWFDLIASSTLPDLNKRQFIGAEIAFKY